MIDKLVLFKGNIETLGYFSEQMKGTFESLGYKVFMFDFLEPASSMKYLKKFIAKDRTALVSFNFIGLDDFELFKDKMGNLIWDVYNVLCVSIMVDHPFYYHPILSQMPKRCIQLCIDRLHLQYLNRFFPQITHTGFLPLAGTTFHEDEYFVPIPYEKRKVDIAFTGNYTPPETFEKHITRVNEEYTAFYWGIIDDLKAHPWTPIDECMEKHLLENLEDEKTDKNLMDSMAAMIFIDLYIRMYFRGEVVKTLVDNGIPVNVYGAGWDKLDCKHPENLIKGRECNSSECLEYIANAKISLNVMPWFKDGAHDRIFNTMMNEAVALTDGSGYIEELYEDKKDIYYYKLNEIDKLPDIVKEILADEEHTKGVIARAYEKTSKDHTWKQRAEAIHKMIVEYID